jgi:hypothetical protein
VPRINRHINDREEKQNRMFKLNEIKGDEGSSKNG